MKLSAMLLGALAAYAYAQAEMDRLMDLKLKHWAKMRAEGAFDNARLQAVAGPMPCVNGKSGPYSCSKVDMLGFLSHQDMGSSTKEGNDVWGMKIFLLRAKQ